MQNKVQVSQVRAQILAKNYRLLCAGHASSSISFNLENLVEKLREAGGLAQGTRQFQVAPVTEPAFLLQNGCSPSASGHHGLLG